MHVHEHDASWHLSWRGKTRRPTDLQWNDWSRRLRARWASTGWRYVAYTATSGRPMPYRAPSGMLYGKRRFPDGHGQGGACGGLGRLRHAAGCQPRAAAVRGRGIRHYLEVTAEAGNGNGRHSFPTWTATPSSPARWTTARGAPRHSPRCCPINKASRSRKSSCCKEIPMNCWPAAEWSGSRSMMQSSGAIVAAGATS